MHHGDARGKAPTTAKHREERTPDVKPKRNSRHTRTHTHTHTHRPWGYKHLVGLRAITLIYDLITNRTAISLTRMCFPAEASTTELLTERGVHSYLILPTHPELSNMCNWVA